MDSDDTPDTTGAQRWVALEFDFLKHLTTLSLAAIGGGVTFAGSLFAAVPDKTVLWAAIGAFCLSGALAFAGQHNLLRRLRAAKPIGRSVWLYREISVGVFFAGAGAFVSFASSKLN